MNTIGIAHGSNPVVQKAAQDAYQLQDAVNMRALVGCFHKHLLELARVEGNGGDELNNHPVTLAFISKLVSLSRMNDTRETAGMEATHKLSLGETVQYEIIPLR